MIVSVSVIAENFSRRIDPPVYTTGHPEDRIYPADMAGKEPNFITLAQHERMHEILFDVMLDAEVANAFLKQSGLDTFSIAPNASDAQIQSAVNAHTTLAAQAFKDWVDLSTWSRLDYADYGRAKPTVATLPDDGTGRVRTRPIHWQYMPPELR